MNDEMTKWRHVEWQTWQNGAKHSSSIWACFNLAGWGRCWHFWTYNSGSKFWTLSSNSYRADFKISKSRRHHFNPSFDFYSHFCQRDLKRLRARSKFDEFWVGTGDFTKFPGLSQDHPGSIWGSSRSHLEVLERVWVQKRNLKNMNKWKKWIS